MAGSYLVAYGNLATIPLEDHPPSGVATEKFDDLSKAQAFAAGVSQKWGWVVVYDRAGMGAPKRIETYRDGRKYVD